MKITPFLLLSLGLSISPVYVVGELTSLPAMQQKQVVEDLSFAIPKNGELPFSSAKYYHFAKNQNLTELIQDFFAIQNITVVVSPSVNANVNGRFSQMEPKEFWDYITKAYNLIWFFDGKIMFVYSAKELQTKIFRMDIDSIVTLASILSRLGFSASDFSYRAIHEANILIVTAPPQYLTVMSDISEKFVPTKISDTTIVKVIPLKNAWAYDMSFTYTSGSINVPGVATLLQSIVTGQTENGSNEKSSTPFNFSVGKTPSKSPEFAEMKGVLDDTPDYAKKIQKSVDKANKNNASNTNESEKEGESVSDISGTTLPGFITCDQRLNAIIIRDRRENIPFYEEIIHQLDVPSEIIKIECAVVDVKFTDAVNWGIQGFSVQDATGRRVFNFSNIPTQTVGDSDKSQFNGSFGGSIQGIFRGWSINGALDALQQSGNVHMLSKPCVLTLDNVGAVLQSDKTKYTAVKGANSSNAYSETATTRFQVVPHIIPDSRDEYNKRQLKLFVDIQEGSFETDISATSQSSVIQHSLNTQAVLYEGQSLLIGGYNQESTEKGNSGIPILKDLPFLGILFRHSNNSREFKERIYIVSPSVVEISSQDKTYERFLQDSDGVAQATLKPKEYNLYQPWTPSNTGKINPMPPAEDTTSIKSFKKRALWNRP